jgi:uncharacterized protein (UPF0303 family)
MTDATYSLADLAAEEEELQFTAFTNEDAWELGTALVTAAREQGAPVAIDISRNRHQLFHAALTGATPDNDSWIRRKARVVHRFGHSSLFVRQSSLERGTTFEEEFGLDPARYAAHGGAFPIIVRSVGPIGVVVVSGLPQVADHRMVVSALRSHAAR